MSKTHQVVPMVESSAKFSGCLYIAFELSRKKWKLAVSDGKSKGRLVTIAAQDWEGFHRQIQRARERFGLAADCKIVSCYEIGREGFWLHRALESQDIHNIVVDAASIEVNRRSKHAKTDRLDAEKLLQQLIRYCCGEARVWSVVRVPATEAEDERQLHRDIQVLKRERTQHRVRIQSLLFAQGIDMEIGARFGQQLEQLRLWNGKPLPEHLKNRLRREYQRLEAVMAELRRLRKEQEQRIHSENSAVMKKVRHLQRLRGIGIESSWVFVMELFWREFHNRRQVGAAVGLTPTPYQSGDEHHEQGISHGGNGRVRALAVEIAWSWLRLQPDSALSQWYRKRFARAGKRMRKVGIVAMARRLVIDLWRYLERGVVPAGARLKVA